MARIALTAASISASVAMTDSVRYAIRRLSVAAEPAKRSPGPMIDRGLFVQQRQSRIWRVVIALQGNAGPGVSARVLCRSAALNPPDVTFLQIEESLRSLRRSFRPDRVWQDAHALFFSTCGARFGRSFHCSDSSIAVNYAGRALCGAVTRSRARSHDRAGQRTRATDAAAHLRGRAGPADGSHQTGAELAASACRAARMAGGHPAGPALLRAGSVAAHRRRSARGGRVGIDRRPDAVGGPVIEQSPALRLARSRPTGRAGRRPAHAWQSSCACPILQEN